MSVIETTGHPLLLGWMDILKDIFFFLSSHIFKASFCFHRAGADRNPDCFLERAFQCNVMRVSKKWRQRHLANYYSDGVPVG